MSSKITKRFEKDSVDYTEYANMYAKELVGKSVIIVGGKEFPFELAIGLTAERKPCVELHAMGQVESAAKICCAIASGQMSAR